MDKVRLLRCIHLSTREPQLQFMLPVSDRQALVLMQTLAGFLVNINVGATCIVDSSGVLMTVNKNLAVNTVDGNESEIDGQFRT